MSGFVFNSVYAQDLPTTVTVKPSLSISIPTSTVSFSLDPSLNDFGSQSLSVSVATNNTNGYKLYIDASTTDLVNINNSSYKIPTLPSNESGYTSDTFLTNYWGYKIGIGNFIPFTSGSLVNQSSEATNGVSSTIAFGAKIDYTKPAGLYSLGFSLKTIPQVTQKYMQEITASDCTEEPTMVMDKRDGHLYAIARLKDGKCWMVQNLRLGENLEPVTGSMTLTDEDTDISTTDTYNPRSEFVLTNQVVDGNMPTSSSYDIPAYYCTSAYGCYYNFYVATAGTTAEGLGAITANNIDATTSICPRGWTMPTGGDHLTTEHPTHSSDWRLLANAYGYGTDPNAVVVARLLIDNPVSTTENINGTFLPGLLLGGFYNHAGFNNGGVNALCHSRTVLSSKFAYRINVYAQNFMDLGSYEYKSTAQPVRCLLQEQ